MGKDVSEVQDALEQVKKELIDRCPVSEMLTIKQALTNHIEAKVGVKEVQTALNECQSDLAEQLTEFKTKLHEKIKQSETNLNRIIERKVDHKELQGVVDSKVDRQEILEKYVYKNEFDALG